MSQRSLFMVLGLLVALIGLTALRIGLPELFGVDEVSADYMIFHQVGELANLGRIAEAREVAETAQFLATEASGFMTGQIITVDGGRSLIDPLEAAAH